MTVLQNKQMLVVFQFSLVASSLLGEQIFLTGSEVPTTYFNVLETRKSCHLYNHPIDTLATTLPESPSHNSIHVARAARMPVQQHTCWFSTTYAGTPHMLV